MLSVPTAAPTTQHDCASASAPSAYYTLTIRDRFGAMLVQMSGPSAADQELLLTAYQRTHHLLVLRRDGLRWQLSNGDIAEITEVSR